MAQTGDKPQKLCFVTIGATASFDALIRASLDREFLSELSKAGYRELQIQYGKDGRPLFEQLVSENASAKELGMKFTGFDFDADGLEEYFGDARNSEGVVVSHAGKIVDMLNGLFFLSLAQDLAPFSTLFE